MSNLESKDKKGNIEGVSYETKIPMSFYLTLSTIIISFAGYLNAKTYYYFFGVYIEKYFAFEDYIRNSISVISIAIIPIMFNVVFMLIFEKSIIEHGFFHVSKCDVYGEEMSISNKKIIKLKIIYVIITLFLIIIYIVPIIICIYEFYRGCVEKYYIYMGVSVYYITQFFFMG